jgi:hypothetical protein
MVALVVGAVRELPESSGDAFSPEEHHGHVSLYLGMVALVVVAGNPKKEDDRGNMFNHRGATYR